MKKRFNIEYIHKIAAISFVAAVLVRLVWVIAVQHPGDALVSDMQGYVERAQVLLSDNWQPQRWMAFYPYGTHFFLALLMRLVGPTSFLALSVIYAVIGAVVVPCMVIISGNLFSSRTAPAVIGALLAFWYPWVSFCGYFSSETLFITLLSLNLLLVLRFIKIQKGGLAVGISGAVAFAVRPQFLLFMMLFAAWLLIRHWAMIIKYPKQMILLVLPLLLVIGFSFGRHIWHTGQPHLISHNSAVQKFWAQTCYATILARELQSDGSFKVRWIRTPPASQLGYTSQYTFTGYVGDTARLDAERRRYQSFLTVPQKIAMLQRNVHLLIIKNRLWPELTFGEGTFREVLMIAWHWLLLLVALLSMFTLLLLLFEKHDAMEILFLHLISLVCLALVYLGEIRYRVPYDGILLLSAIWLIVQLPRLVLSRGRLSLTQDRPVQVAGLIIVGAFLLLVLIPWGLIG